MKLPKYQGFFTPHSRAGDYTGELVNHRTGEVYTPPSRTKQEHVAECDINNIIRDFKVSGQIAHMQARQGLYVDLPDPTEFQDSLHLVAQAAAAFAALPSAVRNRFENDAARFLDFMSDPANKVEIQKMGLAKTPFLEPARTDSTHAGSGAAAAPAVGAAAPTPSQPKA
ncbi:MAG: internal scaffolding protein [Microvirus sp.]|nr:MAG: internal scaffolding protein [Microvirus sp.]